MASTSNLFSLFDDSDFDDVVLNESVSENTEIDIKQDHQTDNLSESSSQVSIEESKTDTLIKQNSLFDQTTGTTLPSGDSSVEFKEVTRAQTPLEDTIVMDNIEEEEEHYNPLDHLFDIDSSVLDDIENFQSQYQETSETETQVEDHLVEEVKVADTTHTVEEPSLFDEEPVTQPDSIVEIVAAIDSKTIEEPSFFAKEPAAEEAPVMEDATVEDALATQSAVVQAPSRFNEGTSSETAPIVEGIVKETEDLVSRETPIAENPVVEELPTIKETAKEAIEDEPSLFAEEPVSKEIAAETPLFTEDPSVETAPVEDTPTAVTTESHMEEGLFGEEAPIEDIPAEEAPAEEAPVEEAPTEDIPAEEAPAEEAPVEEAPIEDIPAEEAPAEEAPVEEAPIEDIPAEEAPVEEAPVEEAPIEDIPAEEAPAEEAPVEDNAKVEEGSAVSEMPAVEESTIAAEVVADTNRAKEVVAEATPTSTFTLDTTSTAPEEVGTPIVEETATEEIPSAVADVNEVDKRESHVEDVAPEDIEDIQHIGHTHQNDTIKVIDTEVTDTIENNNQNQENEPMTITGLLVCGEIQAAQERNIENLENILLKATKVNMANDKPQTYTFEEAQAAATEYFGGDELAGRVWTSKYALKDSFGNLYERTPDDMHHRIAAEIARIENNYPEPMSQEEVYNLLKNFKYIVPQGSPMTGIGNNFQVGSLSNCFVIGLDGAPDSYGGVIRIDEEQVQLMKRRGGVGHDLSHIRPKGTPVKNSALTSTGLVPFMERYSNSTREVAQDGRRGALMLTVSIKHPDSEAFIDAKLTEGKITGANVSVRIDDEFMKAAEQNKPYLQRFPVESELPAISTKEIDANALWHKITHNAWQSAEPGVLFWDTIIRESVPDCYADLGFKTISTNPCGEIPLCPYDSCRLLAINLYSYVKNPFTPEAEFDFELFKKHVGAAQRIMDDIIDLEMEQITKIIHKVEHDPEIDEVKQSEKFLWEKIRTKTLKGRRTGVGTTGEGDMLAALGLRYGTPEATDFSVQVHKTLALAAYNSSVDMARTRGAFPIFDAEREKNNPYINRLKEADPELYENMLKYGRRNIACLTIAPTGTTSLMTQTTSGIEPVFMPVYKRRRKVNPNDQDVRVDYIDNDGDAFEEFVVFHPKFMEWMKVNGIEPRKNYTQEEIDNLVSESPYAGASANEINWMEKVRMQGAIQKWVDHSISVTINLPSDVTPELVNQLYVEAWKAGCKGCTVYRDGCRSGVLVSLQKTKKTPADQGIVPHLEHRPTELEADVVRFQNNKEKWIAFVGLIDGRPYEIFTGIADDDEGLFIPKSITKGKIIRAVNEDGTKRYDFQYVNKRGYKTTIEGLSAKFNPEYWNYAKLISGVLRMGMPLDLVVKLVSGLSLNTESINTWKMGVERALKKYITDGTKASGQTCPNCGQESLVYQEGCLICTNCGTSKCG